MLKSQFNRFDIMFANYKFLGSSEFTHSVSFRLPLKLSVLFGALVLAGCATVNSVPLEESTLKPATQADQLAIRNGVEPLRRPSR